MLLQGVGTLSSFPDFRMLLDLSRFWLYQLAGKLIALETSCVAMSCSFFLSLGKKMHLFFRFGSLFGRFSFQSFSDFMSSWASKRMSSASFVFPLHK